jgi:hypothetical protein
MQSRTLLALLMALALAVPAATAAPMQAPPAQTNGASGSASGASASGSGSGAANANYTALYVEAGTSHLELKPGQTESFSLTVENGEDESVALSPHLYVPPVGESLLKPEWVTIEGPDSLDAGEEATFDVTVAVPEGAELGNYRGQIALTDETVTYPGRPARPVHAVSAYVEVWKEPSVTVTSRTYFSGQVKAGEDVSYDVTVENDGGSAVPLSPELLTQDRRYGGSTSALDPSWVSIDAPAEVGAGEEATVEISVSVPESADRGRYDAQLDLGLKDPNRPERSTYWQEVSLGVEVWKQPAEPYETTFEVSEDAGSIDVSLTPRSQPANAEGEPASFDVALYNPDGEAVAIERVRTTDSGFVDLSGASRQRSADGAYASRSASTQFRYHADVDTDPAGEWTLSVMPHNTIGFGYEIVRNESA